MTKRTPQPRATAATRTPEQTRLIELAASVGFVIAIVIVALWTRVMHTSADDESSTPKSPQDTASAAPGAPTTTSTPDPQRR